MPELFPGRTLRLILMLETGFFSFLGLKALSIPLAKAP